MIWIVFGAMAVAMVVALGRIFVESDPARIRKPARFAAIACWALGLVMTMTGKALPGLVLMAIGALGAGALGAPTRSGLGKRDRHRGTAGRRADGERDDDPGSAERNVRVRPGVMTEEQAYQVLGLQAGASAQEIARAHRTLMKKVHPDQGGTTELAARVNAAKDVLTARFHR